MDVLSLAVSILGLFLGFFGTGGTFVGLFLTYREAAKSATVAEEAQKRADQALREVQDRMTHLKITVALRHAEALRTAYRERDWRAILDRCDTLRNELEGLLQHPGTLSDTTLRGHLSPLNQLSRTADQMHYKRQDQDKFENLFDEPDPPLDDLVAHLTKLEAKTNITVFGTRPEGFPSGPETKLLGGTGADRDQ